MDIKTEIVKTLYESLESFDNETIQNLFELLVELLMIVKKIHESMEKLYGNTFKETVSNFGKLHPFYLKLGACKTSQQEFFENSLKQRELMNSNSCNESFQSAHNHLFETCKQYVLFSQNVNSQHQKEQFENLLDLFQKIVFKKKLPDLMKSMCNLIDNKDMF